jgi:hypothetical protein
VSKGFCGAYCAECDEWKTTSQPSPAHGGVYVCAECFALVIESAIATLPDKVQGS